MEHVRTDMDFHLRQLKRFGEELKDSRKYNGCGLITYERNGKRYFSRTNYRKGKNKVTYLGAETGLTVQILQKRRFLTESLRRIENNIPLMEKFLAKYQSLDPYDIRDALLKAYKFTDETCFDLAGAIDIENWAKKEYRRAEMYPEHLTHVDANGEYLRSKSEVLVANALAAHRIPYRIEESMRICGEIIAPDFIAASKRLNREIYWEHFGRMFEEKYQKKYAHKMFLYAQADILPGYNLITTFDDRKGNIDARAIERLIEAFF